ncbi:hypothetical protein TrST_g2127 [Triparma strigata]|uniref:ETFB lysine methyltransferase n=1 Tax=Triparma strigata TaxID=1606541 RepID=A0A9W7B594_9STRA|nr:hypothetical protein TrST_g2127 [Triparma strigata]
MPHNVANARKIIQRITKRRNVDCLLLLLATNELESNLIKDLPFQFQDPFWAFVWPGSWALHKFIQDNPQVVGKRTVLDFASGCGLAAITAKQNNAATVLANDIDPYSVLSVRMNAALNNVNIDTSTSDLIGKEVTQDVILAGDVFYEEALGADVMKWLEREQQVGKRVLIGDPGRAALPLQNPRLQLKASYDLPKWLQKSNHGYVEGKVYEIIG